MQDRDRSYWLDQPRNVDKIIYTLVGLCVLLLIAEFFYRKDPHFGFEAWFGFYGWYGFIMCVALVLGAKWMRIVLKRDEDHYDD